jgi:DNA segregation ATPase FtsK/SpoIIIE, S-DNA-T family
LQSNESDSRMILGEDNPDAANLVRAGEGILNRKGGNKDANQRFQAAFWQPDERGAKLRDVVKRARAEGYPDVVTVFEGHKPVDVNEIDPKSLIPARDTGFSGVAIPVGLPLTLDPDPLFARLRRESGGNLLIIDEQAASTVAIAVSSLRRQDATIDLLDFVGDDENWIQLRDQLQSSTGVAIHARRTMQDALSRLAAEVDDRQSLNDYKGKPHMLVIAGMDRARDFDAENSYDEEAPLRILGQILRDGPEVGVFVVAWFDRPAGEKKRLGRQLRKEFGHVLLAQVSREDSSDLIESDTAAGLKPGQGVLANVDRAIEQKVRTFSMASPQWFADFNAGVGTE